MNRNRMKSRKAISPILATLLLIVIAVAAIIVTYAWVMTYMSTSTNQAGVMLRKDTACLWMTGNVTIYIRNIGTSDAEIDQVYINSIPQESLSYYPTTRTVAKDGGTLTIVVTFQWTAGTSYHFTVSPKRGEPLNFDETAP